MNRESAVPRPSLDGDSLQTRALRLLLGGALIALWATYLTILY